MTHFLNFNQETLRSFCIAWTWLTPREMGNIKYIR